MPYQYQPLPVLNDPDDVYIRLFELHSFPKSGPITGQLYTTRLSQAPKFYALSYCWGSATRKGTIQITNGARPRDIENDNILEVPVTLIPYLYKSRSSMKTHKIWIDSICLDQRNLDEKNSHVPKMRTIYMKAQCTISWLGAEADGSTKGFEYAVRLNEWYRKHMQAQQASTSTTGEKQEPNAHVDVRVGDPSLEAMLKLLDRPYFDRAWIVQEVVVSREVLLACGESFMPWSTLLGAFVCLMTIHIWLWEFYNGLGVQNFLALKYSEMEWESSIDVNWSTTLSRHRQCLSGDARDKVYALYGLRCKRALDELGIEPEYEKLNLETLYRTLAARSLYWKQRDILHVPRLITGPQQVEDVNFEKISVPSWVPDWRNTEDTPQSLVDVEGFITDRSKKPNYCASKDSFMDPTFDLLEWNTPDQDWTKLLTMPNAIRLSGIRVSIVTQLTRRRWVIERPSSKPTLRERAQHFQCNQQQVHEWEAVFRVADASSIVRLEGESTTDAMYETFMAGSSLWPTAVKRAAATAFESRQRFLRTLHTVCLHGFLIAYTIILLIERLARRFGYVNPEMQFRTMVAHMANRKGARMTSSADSCKEYFALVPGICELGDQVVIVAGVTTPLILSPKGDVAVEGTGEQTRKVDAWELIGDSYVHGMMQGQLWDKEKEGYEDFWIA